jgi:hypothetical protein
LVGGSSMENNKTKQENELLDQCSKEVVVGVSFSGLFSAMTIFFTGLLISNYNSFSIYVRVPILFLIIGAFGFMYTTLIFANASGKLTLKNLRKCQKALTIGDLLSELFGVYPLLIAIPLVIPVITNDPFLIWSVFIVDSIGLIIYHVSGFSILQRLFYKGHIYIALGIISLLLGNLVLLISSNQIYLLLVVCSTILYLCLLFFISLKRAFRDNGYEKY